MARLCGLTRRSALPDASPAPEAGAAGRLARWPFAGRWTLLLVLSLLLAGLLELLGVPAGLLIGPMLAGILVGTNSGRLRVPGSGFWLAQAVIGCMIAQAVDLQTLASFGESWPLFLGVVLAVIAASSFLGWLMSHWKVLPGTTAVWGSSPGAATAMMLMADAFGADARLVAFMQYLRVLFVALTASVIAQIFLDRPAAGAAVAQIVWFPPIDWRPFGETLLLIVVGTAVGHYSRIPAGAMIVPMMVGGALQLGGLMEIVLPQWLLALSWAVIGWNIGLAFTRRILLHAARAMPKIVLSIAALMAFSASLGFLLTWTVGIDPLTAYLATSPGGLDSIAIIAAASSEVDLSFVIGLQTARFLLVLLIGPWVAGMIARRLGRDPSRRDVARPE